MKETEGGYIHIRQPAYLPGIVYFDQLSQVDTHIVYDNVQYERRHWGNRNKIVNTSNPNGWQWLTVPILQKGNRDQWYTDTQIDNSKAWKQNHWKAILCNYAHAPFFKSYADFFEDLYKKPWDKLINLDIAIVDYIKQQLDLKTKIIFSSTLKTSSDFENKNQRLINMVHELGGTTYVTVKGTIDYIDNSYFQNSGVELRWHQFTHPVYPQFQGGFIPNLSVIDLLFNCGDQSREILAKNTLKTTIDPYHH